MTQRLHETDLISPRLVVFSRTLPSSTASPKGFAALAEKMRMRLATEIPLDGDIARCLGSLARIKDKDQRRKELIHPMIIHLHEETSSKLMKESSSTFVKKLGTPLSISHGAIAESKCINAVI